MVICQWCNFKKLHIPIVQMPAATPRATRQPTTLQVQEIQEIQKFQNSWRVLLVEGLLEVRTITFIRDASRKWSLNGWWMRIWIGTGREPSCAEECLDLFQNIIILSCEQFLTADSHVL